MPTVAKPWRSYRRMPGRFVGKAASTILWYPSARARALSYHKLVLAGFPTNVASMRLYERHGFATVGIYHEQGLLDGHWVDTIVMEKILA